MYDRFSCPTRNNFVYSLVVKEINDPVNEKQSRAGECVICIQIFIIELYNLKVALMLSEVAPNFKKLVYQCCMQSWQTTKLDEGVHRHPMKRL